MIWPTQQAEKEPSEFRGHRVPGEFRGQSSGDTMDRVPGTPQSSGDTTEFRGHHTEFRGHHRVPGTQSSGDTEFRGHHTQLREFRDRRVPGTPQSSGGRVRGRRVPGTRSSGDTILTRSSGDTEFWSSRGHGVRSSGDTILNYGGDTEFRGHHGVPDGVPGTPYSITDADEVPGTPYSITYRSSGDTILPEFRGHHTQLRRGGGLRGQLPRSDHAQNPGDLSDLWQARKAPALAIPGTGGSSGDTIPNPPELGMASLEFLLVPLATCALPGGAKRPPAGDSIRRQPVVVKQARSLRS